MASRSTRSDGARMYTIAKTYTFSAAHRLMGLGDDHPCARMHGHNYVVEIVASCACLDERGFCQIDYRELDPIKRWLDDTFDHKTILRFDDPALAKLAVEDVVQLVTFDVNPTAENLAKHIYHQSRKLIAFKGPYISAVRVSETPGTWATYAE